MDTAQQLAHIPLFESLTDAERTELARGLEEKSFAAGATIFNQGDEGGELYIVEEGAVDISINAGAAAAVTVASLFAGQYFGELSLFDGMPRSATATATKPTRLLWLGRDDLVRFIDTNPEGAMKILAEMSNRMRKTNEMMSSQVSRNVLGEHDEKLTLGDKIADRVASFGGSWAFILCFVGVILTWMLANLFIPYDRPGFQLLNLVLAVIAAGQAPVIMMSQNRQETKAKLLAENDYQVNLKNELGIANLQKSMAELLQRTAMLERQVSLLSPRVSREIGTPTSGSSSSSS